MQALLSATRTAVTLAFLFYSSWSDHKTREVSNTVWLLYAPLALSLALVEIYVYESTRLWIYGTCFSITAIFAILLFYAGAFGGADSKAFMCLALGMPFYPDNLFTSPFFETSPISENFFPITVFSNSVILAATSAVYLFLRNLFWSHRTGRRLFEQGLEGESIGRKLLTMVTGYRTKVEKLKEQWHLYPLEDVKDEESGLKRSLTVLPKEKGRDSTVERLEDAVQTGRIENSVWATPGLPMMIFITSGLIIALLLGDITWICVSLLLG